MSTTAPDSRELALATDLVMFSARIVRLMRRLHDIPAWIRTLSLLDEHGPLGVTALAQLDGCSQPSMSASVARLLSEDLVTKRQHPQDARGTVVALSDEGRARLTAMRSQYAQTVVERLSDHSAEELATAVAVLRDLLTGDTKEQQ
jgi:DNA-binding MarR family transcriptional regulator